MLCPPPGPPPAGFLRLLAALSDGSATGAPATGRLELADGEVHVWQARLDEWQREMQVRLASEESDRAARLPSARLRTHFVRSRVLLRAVLASYLGVAPAALAFGYGTQGKPYLLSLSRTCGPSPLHFNLSHARFYWVLAVAREHPVGIDVENISRRVDVEGVGSRVFSAQEVQTLRRLRAPARKEGFFRCWTAREAIAKVRGEGVFTLGARFDVEADPARPPCVQAQEVNGASGTGWELTPIPVPNGFVCLLATAGAPAGFRSYLVSA